MPTGNPTADEPILFSAMLTPHRSLGANGFLLLMLVIGGVSFVSGVFFVLIGAWPVFGFFGLDVALIYWAFRANYRAAAAFEEISVTPSELRVRQVSHRGRAVEWTLNTQWVRLDRLEHEEFGIEKLFLVSRGRRLAIAAFLGPEEKKGFAAALGAAINEAKRGPTRTVFEG